MKKNNMSEAQRNLRNDLLTKIHLHHIYKYLGGDEIWEDFLYPRFGVRSSKYLSIQELYNLLDELNGKKCNIGATPDYRGRTILINKNATIGQINKIETLFVELPINQKAFIKRQTKEEKAIFNLTKAEATKVINGLLALKKTYKDI